MIHPTIENPQVDFEILKLIGTIESQQSRPLTLQCWASEEKTCLCMNFRKVAQTPEKTKAVFVWCNEVFVEHFNA